MMRTYDELNKLNTFEEKLEYLYLGDNKIGAETFGRDRYLNQLLYKTVEWRRVRDQVIMRDNGCDLGVEGCGLTSRNIIVHHINPITKDDIVNKRFCLFDMDNLISASLDTHNHIHYGIKQQQLPIERTPNDTCPWRR